MPIISQFYVMFVLQVGLLSGTFPVIDSFPRVAMAGIVFHAYKVTPIFFFGSNAVSFHCYSGDIQIHLI